MVDRKEIARRVEKIERDLEKVNADLRKLTPSDSVIQDLLGDARSDRRLAVFLGISAVVVALSPSLVIAWRARASAGSVDRTAALIALIGLAFGVLLLMFAWSYQKSSRRSRVLAREIRLLSEYEKPLNKYQRQMMRLALVPRIFVGTADGLDPLSDPEWTGMASLAEAFREKKAEPSG